MSEISTVRLNRFALPAHPLGALALTEKGTELWLSSLLSVIGMMLGAQLVLALAREFVALTASVTGAAMLQLAALGVFALALGLYVIVLVALTSRIWAFAQQSDSGTLVALRVALPRTVSALGVALLYLVIVLLATVALILPGMYLSVSLSMALPCLLFEDLGVMAALKRSTQLTRGSWWRVGTVISIPVTVYVVTVFGVVLVAVLYTGFRDPEAGLVIGEAVRFNLNLAVAALTALFMPWVIAITLVVYHDLILREQHKAQ